MGSIWDRQQQVGALGKLGERIDIAAQNLKFLPFLLTARSRASNIGDTPDPVAAEPLYADHAIGPVTSGITEEERDFCDGDFRDQSQRGYRAR
jgi:hypothetical protein